MKSNSRAHVQIQAKKSKEFRGFDLQQKNVSVLNNKEITGSETLFSEF